MKGTDLGTPSSLFLHLSVLFLSLLSLSCFPRRLNTLNKCASMKLDVSIPKKKVSKGWIFVWVRARRYVQYQLCSCAVKISIFKAARSLARVYISQKFRIFLQVCIAVGYSSAISIEMHKILLSRAKMNAWHVFVAAAHVYTYPTPFTGYLGNLQTLLSPKFSLSSKFG